MLVNITGINKLKLFLKLYNHIQTQTDFGKPEDALKDFEAAQALLTKNENDYCRFELYCDISKNEVDSATYNALYGNGQNIFEAIVAELKAPSKPQIKSETATQSLESKVAHDHPTSPKTSAPGASKPLPEEPQLPFEGKDYDATTLQTVLRAYNIPEGPRNAAFASKIFHEIYKLNSEKNDFTIYCYPISSANSIKDIQNDFLLRDQINYFLLYINNHDMLSSRVFSILILNSTDNKTYAFTVKLKDCDFKQVDSIKKSLEEHQITTADAALQNLEIVAKIKKLYATKAFKWIGSSLGSPQTKPILDKLLVLISKAYVGKVDLKAVSLNKEHHHIFLALQLLNDFGYICQKSLKLAYDENLKYLKESILNKIRTHPAELLMEKLTSSLIVLYKYGSVFIQMTHLKQIAHDKNPTIAELEQTLQICKLLKIKVYKEPFTLDKITNSFTLDLLTRLYAGLDNIDSARKLVKELADERRTELQKIWKLEKDINKLFEQRLEKRSSYFKYYGAKILNFVYQSTLVEFGASTLQFLTRSCSRRWNNRKLFRSGRDTAKQFVRWSARDIKNADNWIAYFEHGIENYLTVESAMYAIGGTIGAWFGMNTSYYSLLRQIMIGLMTMKIFNKLQDSRINDELATFSNEFDSIKPLHCAYLVQVMAAMTEFHYTNDFGYVVRALGGASVGTGTMMMIDRALPGLDNPTSPEAAKEIAIIKFFVHMCGYSLGYQLTDWVLHRYSILERRAFEQHIQKIAEANYFAEYETVGPQDNSYFLGWRYKSHSYWHTVKCQLQQKLVLGEGLVLHSLCEDKPTTSLPLLAAP